LDFVDELRSSALSRVAHGVRAARSGRGTDEAAVRDAEGADAFDREISDEKKYRSVLHLGLQDYFSWKHCEDHQKSASKQWDSLRALGNILEPGDAVITFNYDATLERVLLKETDRLASYGAQWAKRLGIKATDLNRIVHEHRKLQRG